MLGDVSDGESGGEWPGSELAALYIAAAYSAAAFLIVRLMDHSKGIGKVDRILGGAWRAFLLKRDGHKDD